MTWRNGKNVTKPKLERRCPEAKFCSKCKRPLFRKDFYLTLYSKDYLTYMCKECTIEAEKERYQRKKERVIKWLNKKGNK